MAIRLDQFNVTAPGSAVVGIVGENGSGQRELLDCAVQAVPNSRWLKAADPPDFSKVDLLVLDHALASRDALERMRVAVDLERLRRSGSTVLLVSHEEDLLRQLCDEVWWLREGRVEAKGDPRETLSLYRAHVSSRQRSWGSGRTFSLDPSLRRGDGRARLVKIETLDAADQQAMVWQSGEEAAVAVTVQFERAVEDPVIGIMIRTRIGFEVYGTNTELENVRLGPVSAGDALRVVFQFRCDLCANEYTLTAASHDPDGVWHDWMEDAVAFSVTDRRYTAGVANLRARIGVQRLARRS
jgi:Wzt-like putative exopolysaccharide export protein